MHAEPATQLPSPEGDLLSPQNHLQGSASIRVGMSDWQCIANIHVVYCIQFACVHHIYTNAQCSNWNRTNQGLGFSNSN